FVFRSSRQDQVPPFGRSNQRVSMGRCAVRPGQRTRNQFSICSILQTAQRLWQLFLWVILWQWLRQWMWGRMWWRMRRVWKLMHRDRVGLGWRPELAAGIFSALDKIDILEVVGDNYLEANRRQRLALKLLSREVPLHIHSIDLGMAGSAEVSTKRVDR